MHWPARASVLEDPVAMNSKDLSDHAPSGVSLYLARTTGGSQAIPSHVFKSGAFAKWFGLFSVDIRWDDLPPPERYSKLVLIIHAAAEHARNFLSTMPTPSPDHQLIVLSAIARAIASGNKSFATSLAAQCPFAARHIGFSGRVPFLIDPVAFEESFAKSKLAFLNRENSSEGKKSAKYGAALRRKMDLWSKSQPRARLAGLLLPSGEVATSTEAIAAGLSDHWGHIF